MNQNTTKIVIVILVVVAVVFFIGVGVGAGGGNNGQGGLPGISVDSVVSTFGSLIPAPAVGLNEMHGSCLNTASTPPTIVIPGNGNCELNIDDSDANIRALKLEMTAGQAIHIESTSEPIKDKPMPTKADLSLSGKTKITLNFFKTGSSVNFQCFGFSGCALQINS